jgi:uncharacterized protein YjbI with pentapeptide repeats
MMKCMACVLGLAVAGGFMAAGVRSDPREAGASSPLAAGKYLAEGVALRESTFRDVNLAGARFDNVDLSKVRMHNINLSDLELSAAQIGGARFKDIGLPPGQDGKRRRQRPVTFENVELGGSMLTKVDLSDVKLVGCELRGMTIDGVLVTDLIAAYRRQRK